MEKESFESFVRNHHDGLRKMTGKFCRQYHLSWDETYSLVLEAAWLAWKNFDDSKNCTLLTYTNYRAWGIISHFAENRYQDSYREITGAEEVLESAFDDVLIEDKILDEELLRAIDKRIYEIVPGTDSIYYKVYVMIYRKHMTRSEVSKALGITRQRISQIISSIIGRLQIIMN